MNDEPPTTIAIGKVSIFTDIVGMGRVNKKLDEISEQLEQINVKLSELSGHLNEVGDKLEKAQAEILAALDKLASSDPDLSPEGQAAVERVKAIAEALDAVIPDEHLPDV